MKTVRILHLYHDLLNLYGDNGNIRILSKELRKQADTDVIIDEKSVGDTFDALDYDFIYVGAGIERNVLVALDDLRPSSAQLHAYIANGSVLLMTGGSFTMFGRKITLPDGKAVEGMNLFGFETILKKTRDNQDGVYKLFGGNQTELAIGFINKSHEVTLDDTIEPLFDVIKGVGNSSALGAKDSEGVHYKNFYASSLSGPILVKNPWLLEKICVAILSAKDIAYVSQISVEQKMAYSIGLEGLLKIDQRKE